MYVYMIVCVYACVCVHGCACVCVCMSVDALREMVVLDSLDQLLQVVVNLLVWMLGTELGAIAKEALALSC